MGRSKNNPRQLFTRDYFSKDNTLKYPVGGIEEGFLKIIYKTHPILIDFPF